MSKHGWCSTCRFYVRYSPIEATRIDDYGKCHRSAPSTAFLDTVGDSTNIHAEAAVWPIVEGDEDWCGEWKGKRSKTA